MLFYKQDKGMEGKAGCKAEVTVKRIKELHRIMDWASFKAILVIGVFSYDL